MTKIFNYCKFKNQHRPIPLEFKMKKRQKPTRIQNNYPVEAEPETKMEIKKGIRRDTLFVTTPKGRKFMVVVKK